MNIKAVLRTLAVLLVLCFTLTSVAFAGADDICVEVSWPDGAETSPLTIGLYQNQDDAEPLAVLVLDGAADDEGEAEPWKGLLICAVSGLSENPIIRIEGNIDGYACSYEDGVASILVEPVSVLEDPEALENKTLDEAADEELSEEVIEVNVSDLYESEEAGGEGGSCADDDTCGSTDAGSGGGSEASGDSGSGGGSSDSGSGGGSSDSGSGGGSSDSGTGGSGGDSSGDSGSGDDSGSGGSSDSGSGGDSGDSGTGGGSSDSGSGGDSGDSGTGGDADTSGGDTDSGDSSDTDSTTVDVDDTARDTDTIDIFRLYGGEDGSKARCGRNCALPATGINGTIVPRPKSVNYSILGLSIELPSLGVSAEILNVPFVDDAYAVTWLGGNAGLLEGSAMPGEGQTWIAAHNHIDAEEYGPFANIGNLNSGDRVFIADHTDGTMTVYEVYANLKVDADDAESVYAAADEYADSLTLITCEDERVDGGYANRRIICAKPL